MNNTFSQYQAQVTRTMAAPMFENLAIAGLGLTGEAGEVADIIKKIVGHGHPQTTEVEQSILKELGDVLWYVAALCEVLGYNMGDVADMNIAKLAARYPEGFSTERSLNRDGA